jgi:hypothetical protein
VKREPYWLNSNKGTKTLTGFFATFYARRTFDNSAAPKIGSCLVGQFWGLTQPVNPHLFHLTGSSDAQIELISGHESKKSLEIYQHLSLDAVEQAYQGAVQGVSIYIMDTQRCQNHGPVRVLVPLLEFNHILFCAIVSIIATALLPDYTNRDISGEDT